MGVPYDFGGWSPGKEFRTWWDPDDDRVIVPKAFGIGWSVNGAALERRSPLAFWAAVGWLTAWVVMSGLSGRRSPG